MPRGKKTASKGKKASTTPARSPTPPVSDTDSEVPAARGMPPLDEEETAPQKKARKTVNMSATEEKKMVDFIQQNQCLYDKSKRDWLNKTVRDELWRTQVEVMQRTREELTLWYESIRTRLSRLRKTKSGQGAVRITDRDQWILDNFSFLIPHMIEVSRRNTVSLKAKAAAAAGAPLAAASTSTSVDPDDDFILDVPETPDIPPSQPTSESYSLPRPSHTETTTTVGRGKKRPASAPDDSTSTDKRAIDEMQSQREQSNELAQLSRDLLQTIRPTTSLDKHHLCGYLSSQFNEVRPEIWKRYRTRFFLHCDEMVAENDAANAIKRQGQQQQPLQQQPLQQQPLQQQPLQQQPLQQQPLQQQPLQQQPLQQQPLQQQPLQQQPLQQQALQQQPLQQQHVHNPYGRLLPIVQQQQNQCQWQPPPNKWGTQTYPGVSPWNSMDTEWVQRTFPAQTVTRSSPRSPSCPPFTTPTFATLNTPQLPSQGSLDRTSFNASFSSLLNQNRDSKGSVVDPVLDDQQPDQQPGASSDQPPSDDQ